MRRTRSPSKATLSTLRILLDAPKGLHGYEIMKIAGIGPGTLYPILARLEDRAILVSEWQDAPTNGRPPRHIYRLTAAGRAFARDSLGKIGTTDMKPSPA
ncbi:MAG: PadR family transcriptional regulator [Parasphingopyxis sp.]|uniref:PadR family transcriptional regulator n=1 Tax=Parasphingopyxis sp. TaxID=1920299 RepID=UPI003F9ED4C6